MPWYNLFFVTLNWQIMFFLLFPLKIHLWKAILLVVMFFSEWCPSCRDVWGKLSRDTSCWKETGAGRLCCIGEFFDLTLSTIYIFLDFRRKYLQIEKIWMYNPNQTFKIALSLLLLWGTQKCDNGSLFFNDGIRRLCLGDESMSGLDSKWRIAIYLFFIIFYDAHL